MPAHENRETRVTIRLLTEDSGKQGLPTLEALTRHILAFVSGQPIPDHVAFEPPEDQAAREAIRGNQWKSRKADRARRMLVREIAGTLLQDRGFVIFHVDADCTWKRGQKETPETIRQFNRMVLRAVERAVGDAVSDRGRSGRKRARRRPTSGGTKVGPAADPAPEDVDAVSRKAMRRLILFVPHWCMEAWLYQNTEEAARICREKDQGRHVAVFERWADNRGALDEMVRPKQKSGTCLGDRYNERLARQGFPVQEANAVGKSFARAVDAVRRCMDDTHHGSMRRVFPLGDVSPDSKRQ